MKYCGIEIKSNEAIIVIIQVYSSDYKIIASRLKKIKLTDSKDQKATLAFRETFKHFFEENNFDKIGIKERRKKGKFAGGADSFRMEGIIHTLDYPIVLINPNTIKSKIKDMTLKTEDINVYQHKSLKTALSLISD